MYRNPIRYTEIDSVAHDFLAVQEALDLNEKPDLLDYSCIYNNWLVEYDEWGIVYLTELGSSAKMPINWENEYWQDRTIKVDLSLNTTPEELWVVWNEEIKPVIQ